MKTGIKNFESYNACVALSFVFMLLKARPFTYTIKLYITIIYVKLKPNFFNILGNSLSFCENFPFPVFVVIISVILAVIVAITSSNDQPPRYHKVKGAEKFPEL